MKFGTFMDQKKRYIFGFAAIYLSILSLSFESHYGFHSTSQNAILANDVFISGLIRSGILVLQPQCHTNDRYINQINKMLEPTCECRWWHFNPKNTNHNTSNKTILQIKFKQLKINENRYRNHTTPLEPKQHTCVYYRRCTQTKIKCQW